MLKVLAIVGAGRSGSTALEAVLNAVPGFFAVGERYHLWRHLLQGRLCGCGQPLGVCPFWSEVFREHPEMSPQRALEVQHAETRLRHTRRILRARKGRPGLDGYRQLIGSVYRGASALTGSRILIDSSKRGSEIAATLNLPGIDLYVLHLVRDPRAVVHSQRRRRVVLDRTRPDAEAPGISMPSALAAWLAENLAAELVGAALPPERHRRLRYEDFVRAPQATVRDLTRWLSDADLHLPFVAESTIATADTHAVGGNFAKFTRGNLEIRGDNTWRRELRRRDRAFVTSATLPLMTRYGYLPLRNGLLEHEDARGAAAEATHPGAPPRGSTG